MSNQLNKYQAIVITGFTGTMVCDLSSFHADVESRMGRSVWTHEFGLPSFAQELKELYRDEFMYLCNTEKSE